MDASFNVLSGNAMLMNLSVILSRSLRTCTCGSLEAALSANSSCLDTRLCVQYLRLGTYTDTKRDLCFSQLNPLMREGPSPPPLQNVFVRLLLWNFRTLAVQYHI